MHLQIYVEHDDIEKSAWFGLYKEVKELLSPDMQEPLGNPIQMTTNVDSDHTGTRSQSIRSKVLVFLNNAPALCYFKK
jgi:hypothetical protein